MSGRGPYGPGRPSHGPAGTEDVPLEILFWNLRSKARVGSVSPRTQNLLFLKISTNMAFDLVDSHVTRR